MAELILTLHFLVILFFIAGFGFGLWKNHRLFRIVHASLLAGVVGLMILGIPCPLTVWEEFFRDQSYQGSFIAYWLRRLVYLEWITPRQVLVIDLTFAALVFTSFFWRPLPKIPPQQ